MARVYRPAEDSLLLLAHARGRVHGSVLDMGTGSGFLAVEVASEPLVDEVVAVDVDPEAVKEAVRRAEEAGVADRIEFVVSDLFRGLEGRRFDWILFNPPYLPSEGAADEASWAGGEVGDETTMRFLLEAGGHLEPDGAILLVYSSHTGLDLGEVEKMYTVYKLGESSLFFERIVCLMLELVSPSGTRDKSRRRMRRRRGGGRRSP
jgi:release factor glutamine methyltransferase